VEHEIKGVVEFFLRHLPGDQRAVGELGGKQRLAHAANDARLLHGPDAFQHRFERHTGFFRDHMEGLALESGDQVFGNRQDFRIDRIVVFDGKGGSHLGMGYGNALRDWRRGIGSKRGLARDQGFFWNGRRSQERWG
jgi:hypothetical protein